MLQMSPFPLLIPPPSINTELASVLSPRLRCWRGALRPRCCGEGRIQRAKSRVLERESIPQGCLLWVEIPCFPLFFWVEKWSSNEEGTEKCSNGTIGLDTFYLWNSTIFPDVENCAIILGKMWTLGKLRESCMESSVCLLYTSDAADERK